MSTESVVPAMRFAAAGDLEHCIAQRPDGVYADPGVLGTTLIAAVDAIFRDGRYFAGVDYPILIKALYGHGPALPTGPDGVPQVRIAAEIRPFDPARKPLYHAVKISGGWADYVFEPAWLPDPADPDAPEQLTALDVDEFIADVWTKGVRFGIDVDAVRAAMAAAHAGRADRVTVARRLEPVQGVDAHVDEVSRDIHRSDAPRQLADGRLDLTSFQNRFPQIQAGVRLLQKIAATQGERGFEVSGSELPAKPGRDMDLAPYAGPGTQVERGRDGEFLVSTQAGFLTVDAKTSRVSVGDKIVSHDGVSARTTGNLQLTGDYEEFGDVQEMRTLEGEGIVVHGDVYGHLVSRGGTVLLHANLIGGSVANRRGDIVVRGVASNAVLQAEDGAVTLERAENCVVSGTRIRIGHAINCEVIGDEVEVEIAEGSAIAGRRVTIDGTTPRKQSEMLVAVLCPEGPHIEEVIAAVGQRVAQFDALVAQLKSQLEAMTSKPDVRRYLMLASRVRKNEISLSPEQARQFQRMGQDAGPALKAIGEASNKVKAAEAQQREGGQMLARLEAQRVDAASVSAVTVRMVQGETQVRILGYSPAAGSAPYRLAPRDIRTRLRGPQRGELLFSGSSGQVAWNSADALSQG
ncbi:flagellar assembly protein A [Massilia sp. TN1-12]|uniref:flagellar assembly protein A n=1 Tax=Massilia paldalensis TaxID=3377675 RepID=UPI00384CE5FF